MKKILNAPREPIQAEVMIPGSKSISNRALLLAALAEGVSTLRNLQASDDVRALIAALSALGVDIRWDEKFATATVSGRQGWLNAGEKKLYCGESGTLARFLVTACAAMPGVYHFDAAPSLRKRPLASLLALLASQGILFDPSETKQFPFSLRSEQGLRGGEMVVDASQTSQLVSAFLIMAPFTKQTLKLVMKNAVSRSYVDLTCSVMADFGVQVKRLNPESFVVPQPQRYQAVDYTIEPDFSTASYFFAAAAVTGGEVMIQPVQRKNIKQGDVVFLSMLEQMGCVVEESKTGLSVKGRPNLQGIEVNMKTCPDLFMTLAAIAPFAQTPTRISGIAHTRYKESDRLSTMRKGLEALGVRVETGEDGFTIYPGKPRSGRINSANDHRIAMAFAVLSLGLPELIIEDAHCVSKSCPAFFQMWQKMLKRDA